jgi:hypothetical protein
MDADPHAALRAKAAAYLRERGTLAAPAVVAGQVGDAFAALEAFLDEVPADRAARAPAPGAWSVQEVVDHLLETHRPGLDELRCLLAGVEPPGDPIPAGLSSKAPLLRPWTWLRRELGELHREIADTLAGVPPDFATPATAALVMVVNARDAEGRTVPVHWVERLDWKAYAIVWRLHAVDHLHQGRRALAALR